MNHSDVIVVGAGTKGCMSEPTAPRGRPQGPPASTSIIVRAAHHGALDPYQVGRFR